MKYKILYSSAFLFAMILPFSTKLGNVLLGAFLGLVLLIVLTDKKRQFKFSGRVLLFSTIPFFALLLQGLFFTENIPQGFNLLGRYLTYLLVPVFIGFLDKETLQECKSKALYGLISGVAAASVVLLTNNFIRYYTYKAAFTIDKDLFNYYHTYFNFTKILNMHPTYYGMYVLLALISAVSFFLKEKKTALRVAYFIAIGIFSITIIFLNARIIAVLAFFILMYFAVILLKRTLLKNKILFAAAGAIIMLLGLTVYKEIKGTYIFSRFTQELKWELSPNVNTAYNGKYKADSRVVRWQAAILLIGERPLFGYGCAMEKQVLKEKYLEEGLLFSAKNEYDAHNQYLSFLLEFGVIGLLFFFVFSGSNLYFAVTRKDLVSAVLFILLLSVAIFEDIFKNNAGIIFISFFSNLFLFVNYENNIKGK